MAIFDPGPQPISDYISDINRLIISFNQLNSTSTPLVRTPSGAAEMLSVLNQIVQGLNNAGISVPMFNGPQDASAFLSLINTLNILVGTGKSGPVMPAGALGIWYASDYKTAPRKTIPNSLSPSADPNFIAFPRGVFSHAQIWGNSSGLTSVTDNNAAAPDGSMEASTIVAPAATNWFMGWSRQADIPAGTYTVGVSVKAVSGTPNFKIGDFNGSNLGLRTATGAWQRFSFTFTSASSPLLCIASPDGSSAGTYQICDFQLYPGTVDLNTTSQTLKPIAIRNAEFVVGWTGNEASQIGTVSGGAFQHGGLGAIQFPSAVTPSPFTFVYLARRFGTAPQAGFEGIINYFDATNSWGQFMVGNNSYDFGTTIQNAPVDSANGVPQFTEDNFSQIGSGSYFGAHRYDGTKATAFVNGTKLLSVSVTQAAVPVRTLSVGGMTHGWEGGHDIYAMAFYPRALSDLEIQQAYTVLKAKAVAAGVPISPRRIVVFDGDSITQGGTPGNGYSYAYRFAPNSNPPSNGANYAVAGNHISDLAARAAIVDAIITGSDSTKFILSVDAGTNDLIVTPGSTAAVISALQSYCDARRAAGWKVVVHTLLARTDAADGGTAFNSDRAVVNTAIKNFVAQGHADAVCDIGGNATIGTNTAPNQTAAASATIAAGGTGYTNGSQVLSIAGGASFNVTVTGGAVTSVNSLASGGAYTYATQPANPVATTGGGGTGATLNVTFAGVYFKDKIHPTDAGYAIWEPILTPIINGL